MHEESLGNVLYDYLTGEKIEETSYEEFRQALARMLVEEKGYPKDRLTSKVGVCFPVDGSDYTRMIDLYATDAAGDPLLFVIFCGMTRIMISMTLGQSQDSATQPQTLPRVLTAAPLSALAATILLGFATCLIFAAYKF